MKQLLPILTGSVALVVSALPGTAIAQPQLASKLKGHWVVTTYEKCVNSADNYDVCKSLIGPIAALRSNDSTVIQTGVDKYVVDGRGHFVHKGTGALTEGVPNGTSPQSCSPLYVFRQAFAGTCRVTSQGRGHIIKGQTSGLREFWDDNLAVIYGSDTPAAFEQHLVGAQANGPPAPAVAGVYKTKKYLRLMGISDVPAGVTVRISVKHKR